MKKVSELVAVENLQAQQQEQLRRLNESKTCEEALLKRIFATFTVVYGASWTKNLASEELTEITKHLWTKGLKGLTRKEIEYGLDNLKGEFAVNPHTFASWCKGGDSGLNHNTAAYRKFDKSRALEKKADKETARLAMQKIRQMQKQAGVISHG